MNAPGANGSPRSAGDNPAFRRIRLYLPDTAEAGMRSLNHGSRRGISAGGTVKNNQSPTPSATAALSFVAAAALSTGAAYNEEIVDRIHAYERMAPNGASNLRVGSAENPDGCGVSVRFA